MISTFNRTEKYNVDAQHRTCDRNDICQMESANSAV